MGEAVTMTPTALESNVLPTHGGLWRATCECGNESVQRDQAAAWDWLVSHVCLADIPRT